MLRSLHPFARPLFVDATLTHAPQLFNPASTIDNNGWQDGCTLQGFPVGGGDRLHNLGTKHMRIVTMFCSHHQDP